MNPNTGHLIDLTQHPEKRHDPNYEPVPPGLWEEARRRLAGKPEAWVPRRGKSPLAKYAAERRKAKRKAEKLARKRNR